MRETFVELGIIVKSVRYGEHDAKLALFTANGIRWITVKGVYRPKARFASSINIFTIAEFTTTGGALTGVNVLVSPFSLSKDINRYYLACSIADCLFSLKFIEQTPQVMIESVNAITKLCESDQSCYLIFIDYFSTILTALGYQTDIKYDKEKLSHTDAKKIVRQIVDAFLFNVDYKIQFCDIMY